MATSVAEVNLAYAKVKAMNTDARHVMSACRLPGRNFHNLQQFYDDDDIYNECLGCRHAGCYYIMQYLSADVTMPPSPCASVPACLQPSSSCQNFK